MICSRRRRTRLDCDVADDLFARVPRRPAGVRLVGREQDVQALAGLGAKRDDGPSARERRFCRRARREALRDEAEVWRADGLGLLAGLAEGLEARTERICVALLEAAADEERGERSSSRRLGAPARAGASCLWTSVRRSARPSATPPSAPAAG